MSEGVRVRQDQPTIVTLAAALEDALQATHAILREAGFTRRQVIINAVVTSHDPDDDVTTWAVGTKIPRRPDPLLVRTLEQLIEEARS